MTLVLIFLGGMVGAPARYLLDRFVQSRHDSVFPWGTWVVNITGCLILGALTGAGSALPSTLSALLVTGFCGALTTYSTFGYEVFRLLEQRHHGYAVTYVVLSVSAGLGVAAIGYATVHAFVA